jgi:hypothetical protein
MVSGSGRAVAAPPVPATGQPVDLKRVQVGTVRSGGRRGSPDPGTRRTRRCRWPGVPTVPPIHHCHRRGDASLAATWVACAPARVAAPGGPGPPLGMESLLVLVALKLAPRWPYRRTSTCPPALDNAPTARSACCQTGSGGIKGIRPPASRSHPRGENTHPTDNAGVSTVGAPLPAVQTSTRSSPPADRHQRNSRAPGTAGPGHDRMVRAWRVIHRRLPDSGGPSSLAGGSPTIHGIPLGHVGLLLTHVRT